MELACWATGGALAARCGAPVRLVCFADPRALRSPTRIVAGSVTRDRERVRQLLSCGSRVVEGLRTDLLEAEFLRLEDPSTFEPGCRFNGLAVAVHEGDR
eukprot:4087486-Prymnesium_polylepis.1